MTYADARYEVLHISIGSTKNVAGHVVTRWSEERFELDTWGKSSLVLERALEQMGFYPQPDGGPGRMVAAYQAETGCDWTTALVACNCD